MQFRRSEQMYAAACEVLANGVASGMRKHVTPGPLYFARADGPYYYDVDGHRLLDYTLAWGPLIVGSNNPRLNDAVTRQLSASYTLGAQHHGEIQLARMLVDVLPGVDQVIFSNTGSEAVQAALRLARAYTGRTKIVKFEGHYHGWFNNILVSYHPDASALGRTTPSCGGQPAAEYADTIVLPWNDLGALARLFAAAADEIACVITEPLLANSGSCEPQPGFLDGLVALCRQHGAVSIFDEVITGFRLALGGAREYYACQPDLSVYAKAIAGGFPFSAVGGRREIFTVLRDGRTIHAGTYNGNSIAVAAAIETIAILAEDGVFTRMHQHGNALRSHLEAAAKSAGRSLITCGSGTVFHAHFGLTTAPRNYAETLAADAAAYAEFRRHMLAEGVQLLPDGRWYVGTAHTDDELQLARTAISAAMGRLA